MNFPCPNKIVCPGTDFPVTNFSSEDADPPIFVGYSSGTSPTHSFVHYGQAGPVDGDPPGPLTGVGAPDTGTGGVPPPLDWEWDNWWVTTFAESTVSQEEADADAGNDNIDATADVTGSPSRGGFRTPTGIPNTIFVNHPQTCTIMCSDGSPFSFTVPVGRFRSLTQAGADRAAYSYACRLAYLNRVCLGSISSRACVNNLYNQTIRADAANVPIDFTVVAGILPSWITATVGGSGHDRVTLNGTPTGTDVGTSSFTIEAVDAFGYTMTKAYSITVIGLTTSTTLPVFTKNVAYSSQMTAGGGTAPYTFTKLSGDFPPGITMNSSGLVSGTPTVDPALYPVFISITDSAGRTCTDTVAFDTSGNCVPAVVPALANTYAVSAVWPIFATPTSTIFCVDSTDFKTILEVNPSTGTILNSFTIGADSISYLHYEDTHKRLYAGYTVGGLRRVASISPTTRTIVNSTTLGGSLSPGEMVYDPVRDKMWVLDGNLSTIYVVNCSTFAVSTVPVTPSVPGHIYSFNTGMAYDSSSDLICVLMQDDQSGTIVNVLGTINPGTLALSLFPMSDFGTLPYNGALVYCPTVNRLFAAWGGGATPQDKVYCIQVSSPNMSTSIVTSAYPAGLAYNSCTDRIQVICENNATHVITTFYIDPNTNTVTSNFAIVPTLHQTQPMGMWFDSVFARMLVGTRTALLRFT